MLTLSFCRTACFSVFRRGEGKVLLQYVLWCRSTRIRLCGEFTGADAIILLARLSISSRVQGFRRHAASWSTTLASILHFLKESFFQVLHQKCLFFSFLPRFLNQGLHAAGGSVRCCDECIVLHLCHAFCARLRTLLRRLSFFPFFFISSFLPRLPLFGLQCQFFIQKQIGHCPPHVQPPFLVLLRFFAMNWKARDKCV